MCLNEGNQDKIYVLTVSMFRSLPYLLSRREQFIFQTRQEAHQLQVSNPSLVVNGDDNHHCVMQTKTTIMFKYTLQNINKRTKGQRQVPTRPFKVGRVKSPCDKAPSQGTGLQCTATTLQGFKQRFKNESLFSFPFINALLLKKVLKKYNNRHFDN